MDIFLIKKDDEYLIQSFVKNKSGKWWRSENIHMSHGVYTKKIQFVKNPFYKSAEWKKVSAVEFYNRKSEIDEIIEGVS